MPQISPPTLWRVLLLGRCPRCGKGKLFASFLSMHAHCAACQFPIKRGEQADGPAYTALCIVSVFVTWLAFWVEMRYQPSAWVHIALWLPTITLGSLVMLRIAKAGFLWLHWRTKPENFEE